MATPDKFQYNISLDDESKELIRQLVKAVDRIADAQALEADVSFGDRPGGSYPAKRLIEAPLTQGERIYSAKEIQEQGERFLKRLTGQGSGEYRGRNGEGDYLLNDDEHEGEDLE